MRARPAGHRGGCRSGSWSGRRRRKLCGPPRRSVTWRRAASCPLRATTWDWDMWPPRCGDRHGAGLLGAAACSPPPGTDPTAVTAARAVTLRFLDFHFAAAFPRCPWALGWLPLRSDGSPVGRRSCLLVFRARHVLDGGPGGCTDGAPSGHRPSPSSEGPRRPSRCLRVWCEKPPPPRLTPPSDTCFQHICSSLTVRPRRVWSSSLGCHETPLSKRTATCPNVI